MRVTEKRMEILVCRVPVHEISAKIKVLEVRGIDPRTSHMLSERSTI